MQPFPLSERQGQEVIRHQTSPADLSPGANVQRPAPRRELATHPSAPTVGSLYREPRDPKTFVQPWEDVAPRNKAETG